MKRIFAVIIIINCINVTNAQWFWQNPLPTGNSLQSVKFISTTVGWAVGVGGTILRTTDGGTTWTLQSSGTFNDLYGVSPLYRCK